MSWGSFLLGMMAGGVLFGGLGFLLGALGEMLRSMGVQNRTANPLFECSKELKGGEVFTFTIGRDVMCPPPDDDDDDDDGDGDDAPLRPEMDWSRH